MVLVEDLPGQPGEVQENISSYTPFHVAYAGRVKVWRERTL